MSGVVLGHSVTGKRKLATAEAKQQKKQKVKPKIPFEDLKFDNDEDEDAADERRKSLEDDPSFEFVPTDDDDDDDDASTVASSDDLNPEAAVAEVQDLVSSLDPATKKVVEATLSANAAEATGTRSRPRRNRKPVQRFENSNYFREEMQKAYQGTLNGKKKAKEGFEEDSEQDFAVFCEQLRKDTKKQTVLIQEGPEELTRKEIVEARTAKAKALKAQGQRQKLYLTKSELMKEARKHQAWIAKSESEEEEEEDDDDEEEEASADNDETSEEEEEYTFD
jgi:hypothetical protein